MFAKAQPLPQDSEPQPIIIQQLTFPPLTMTVEGMMEELHISRKTAYDLVRQDGFPTFRIGSRILINREGLQQWINRQCLENAA